MIPDEGQVRVGDRVSVRGLTRRHQVVVETIEVHPTKGYLMAYVIDHTGDGRWYELEQCTPVDSSR